METEFNFNTLVEEAYTELNEKTNNSHNNLILPELVVEINPTRLHWKNVKDYLKRIQRSPDHFMDWLKSQLPSQEINWFSGSKSDGLIIHGKRQKKAEVIELARKYVNNYVICSSCISSETIMTKSLNKQYQFECLICGMKKYLA